jgi:hypothetical protein
MKVALIAAPSIFDDAVANPGSCGLGLLVKIDAGPIARGGIGLIGCEPDGFGV